MTSQADPNTNLLLAAKNGDLAGVVTALAAGADINYRIGLGWTAAMWAARGHHVEIVSYLAEKGADLAIRDGLIKDCWDISAKNYLENYSRSFEIQDLIRRNPKYKARVAEMAEEARAFAKTLAKRFGGRTRAGGVVNNHSVREVLADYRGMRCEFLMTAGGFDLSIQNFRFEDLIISLNIEHRDNKTHPEERDGMLAVPGVFSEEFPIYYFPTAEAKVATKKFFDTPENRHDLAKLRLNRYEWMAMTPFQITLRNQSTDIEVIRGRLDALANVFERYHRTISPPLLQQRYAIKYSMSEDYGTAHRFGGPMQRKIKCPQCDEDFCQVASFDSADERFAGIKWKRKRIVAALCPVCSLYDTSSLTCVSYAGSAPEVIYQSDQTDNGDPERLPFGYIVLSPIGKRAGEFKSRLGGEPGWVQGDDTPDCPCCKVPMRFFVQFVSEDGVVFGADEGMAYIFLCQPCLMVGVAIQSH